MIPVSRLNVKPTHRATLIDLTLDSDGKVYKFIGNSGTLPLHPLGPRLGGYYVAVLVSGAYQEVVSSKHSLFGGPSMVCVVGVIGNDGAFEVSATHLGPTTGKIISTMMYDVKHNIGSAFEETAREKVWGMVGALLENDLHTMTYLMNYKPPPTA